MQEEEEEDEDHFQKILSFRRKSGKGIAKSGLSNEEYQDRKGWAYWLSFGCVRSKSTNELHQKDKEESGTIGIKISNVRGIRIDKNVKKKQVS